jgi:hypothetical protein
MGEVHTDRLEEAPREKSDQGETALCVEAETS